MGVDTRKIGFFIAFIRGMEGMFVNKRSHPPLSLSAFDANFYLRRTKLIMYNILFYNVYMF